MSPPALLSSREPVPGVRFYLHVHGQGVIAGRDPAMGNVAQEEISAHLLPEEPPVQIGKGDRDYVDLSPLYSLVQTGELAHSSLTYPSGAAVR